MKTELSNIWSQTLALLEKEVPRPSFETWLKNARPVALYEDTIIVGAPNDLAKSRLESLYSASIKRAIRTITNRDIKLNFVIPGADPSSLENDSFHYQGPLPSNESLFKPLNSRYTFETFVVGNSNRFAHAACLAVAETPARAYNPLFLYGGVGLGKTHLMHAIGHFVLNERPSARVCYISTETFTNEFINCLRDNNTVDFQTRYRNVDILLIDDIQFLAGKERTQEEFYHTFNAIHEANKQIVISSDRPPKEIPTLEDRLRSRFEWGLICDIQAPDLETRIAILRKKAKLERLSVPDDVMLYVATRIDSNIRWLEGAMNRVIAHSSLNSVEITLESAAEALKDILPSTKPKQITIKLIQQAVAEQYSLKLEDFKVRKRTRAVAFPRQVAMYLAREMTDFSLPKIGEEFGGRDHTTVIHACDKIAEDISRDPALAATIQDLSEKLRAN